MATGHSEQVPIDSASRLLSHSGRPHGPAKYRLQAAKECAANLLVPVIVSGGRKNGD